MNSDERIRLLFELQTEQIAQGKASFDELMASITALKAASDAGDISQAEYAEKLSKLANEASKATKELDKLEASVAKTAAANEAAASAAAQAAEEEVAGYNSVAKAAEWLKQKDEERAAKKAAMAAQAAAEAAEEKARAEAAISLQKQKMAALEQERAYKKSDERLHRQIISDLFEEEAATKNLGQTAAMMGTTINAGMQKASRGAGMFGMNLRTLSYTLDDLQYVGEMGIRPIINNVMMMSPAAGIALMAVDQLARHWTQLNVAMGNPILETDAERMETLGKKTHKTADETAEFNRLKREQNEIEALLAGKSKEEKDNEKGVKDVIEEFGSGRLIKGLAAERATKGEGAITDMALMEADPQYRKDINSIEGSGVSEDQQEKLKKTARKNAIGRINHTVDWAGHVVDNPGGMNEFLTKQAAKDLMNAETNPKALDALINEIAGNKGAFAPGLADKLKGATPEALAKERERKALEKRQDESKKWADAILGEEKDVREKAEREESGGMAWEREWQEWDDQQKHFGIINRDKLKAQAERDKHKAEAKAHQADAKAKAAQTKHDQDIAQQAGNLGEGLTDQAEIALAQGNSADAVAGFLGKKIGNQEVARKAVEKAQIDLTKRLQNLQVQGIEGGFAQMRIIQELMAKVARLEGMQAEMNRQAREAQRQIRMGNNRRPGR